MSVQGVSRIARRLAPWMLLAGALTAALRVASGTRLERADFVFNNSVEITTLDPATVTGVPEGRIIRAIYEGLMVLDPETLEPLPGQAESYEISEDGLLYTFTLRPDALWSNGDPVTAHDFVFSFRRVLHPETAAQYAYQLWFVQGAEDYSTWPPDRYSTADVWVRPASAKPGAPRAAKLGAPREGDVVRIGVTPAVTREFGRPQALRFAALGPLKSGGLIATLFGRGKTERLVESPISGRIVEHNATVFDDPGKLQSGAFTDEHWIAEIALDEAGANSLAQLGFGEIWRTEALWPGVGIRALSDTELEIRLENPTPFFLDLMAFYPLFPVHRQTLLAAKKRWPRTWQSEWVKPKNLVTNGPYTIEERRINDRIRLRKNPRYWDAQNVAFRTIDALAVDHYGTALNLYLTGECDWLNGTIPANLVPRLLEREDFNPALYLGSYFYRINTTKPPLDDARVRRALALTINRRAICTNITKAGQRPLYSVVPPGLRGYSPQAFGPEDIDKAKQLLDEAGFGPGGRPFPAVEIVYNTSETHRDIAEVIADGWRRHLGIEVQLLNQEWKVFLDTERNLKYDISRGAWIADYADPNTFLDLFTTDGENNRTGWSNPEYDALIAAAAREPKTKLRNQLLNDAERLLMSELPILPIYAYASQNLVNPRLGGFYENNQDLHFPKFWYWKSDEELKSKRVPPKKTRVEARGPSSGLYAPGQRNQESAGPARAGGNRIEPPRPQGTDGRGPGGQGSSAQELQQRRGGGQ